MSKKQLKSEISRQVAAINANRIEAIVRSEEVIHTLANPIVLAGGLVGGFLVGYFCLAKKATRNHDESSEQPNSNALECFLTSPLFLTVVSLLRK